MMTIKKGDSKTRYLIRGKNAVAVVVEAVECAVGLCEPLQTPGRGLQVRKVIHVRVALNLKGSKFSVLGQF